MSTLNESQFLDQPVAEAEARNSEPVLLRLSDQGDQGTSSSVAWLLTEAEAPKDTRREVMIAHPQESESFDILMQN